MTGIPTNPNEWGQFTQQLQQVVPQRTENLGMMAQWGGEEDNWLRSYGAKMPSPTINPQTTLNFEQRILNPNSYPKIQNGDGTFSTHRMAWGGDEGNYMAYPTIVQQPDGQLQRLDDKAALAHAQDNKEFRHFSKAEDAQAYAEGGYKKFWGMGERPNPETVQQTLDRFGRGSK